MRRIAFLFALISFFATGCDKQDEQPEFAANYKGSFVRTTSSSLADPIMADVTLNFTENTFSGTSNIRNYPAICNGSFTITQSKVTVKNSCYFTADFEWSYIFNGTYNYEQSGDQLRIWRDYPDGRKDVYQLTKVN